MRIAIFDYHVMQSNPIGGCHLKMIEGLCEEHDFVVFARDFANPRPDRIRHVRVQALRRPMALLYLSYHFSALIAYLLEKLRDRRKFDITQGVESNFSFGNLTYSQFCHAAFLERGAVHAGASRLRRGLRWLDHKLHSLLEPFVYRRTKVVVVPSTGLRHELADRFPGLSDRLRVIANPVDVARMRRPAEFDPTLIRGMANAGPDDILVSFVALGHFERKGLPLLLEAMAGAGDRQIRLVVVGGAAGLIREYRGAADRLGLGDRVTFAGHQLDVRHFLWSSDIFALPSQYEAFPLVVLEAAAAGLPVLVTPLHGAEEFIADGDNGFVVERTSDAVQRALSMIAAAGPERLRSMGAVAQASVERYSIAAFIDKWRTLYQELSASSAGAVVDRQDRARADLVAPSMP